MLACKTTNDIDANILPITISGVHENIVKYLFGIFKTQCTVQTILDADMNTERSLD